MKLVRWGARGEEKPGLIDPAGAVRDLSGVIDDVTVDAIAALTALDPATLPLAPADARLGVPWSVASKIVAIGLNYADHAKETGAAIPTEPVMFMKALSSLSGPDDDVVLPQGSTHSDWEVELGVVIGRTCRYVAREDALAHVAGFVLVNDVSERFNQKQRGSQWSKGKGHDTFCPAGPWLVTPDEIGDVQDLAMSLDLNGARVQTGSTATMIFPVDALIAYVSEYVTLLPGDLLITGTPPGVGDGMKPPRYLAPGDEMALAIDGLGRARQRVVAWSHAAFG